MSFRFSARRLILFIFGFATFHFQLTTSNVHTHGAIALSSGEMFDNRELFSRNLSESKGKDYALFYKYRAPSMDGMVGYVVLNSSAASSGSVTANDDMGFNKERVVEATARIQNASKFSVDMKIFGFSSGVSVHSFRFLQLPRSITTPRSFALICSAVRNRRRDKSRTLEYGKRVDGDFLIRFERHQAMTKTSKFPSHTFHFFDGDINISYVKLTIDSPTAIVFSNKIVLEKYKFYAKIFGTDFNTFTAEMYIYGTKVSAANQKNNSSSSSNAVCNRMN